MSVISMLLIGLVVGAIAKLLMPGDDPGGIIVTMLLGVAGSFVAGYLGKALGWYHEGDAVGFVAAVVGAIVLLLVYRVLFRRRRLH
ncbi:MAG: GlsB/YeaQ/YmgE family stress response rane protein [Verrucomicrobia bacterium]|nr:GlsB/YeaQ/YmgE family stress response rane protein [Verrucomicrobiota bacterium]